MKPIRIQEQLEEDILGSLEGLSLDELVEYTTRLRKKLGNNKLENVRLDVYYDDHDRTTLRIIGDRPETQEEISKRSAYEMAVAEKNAKRKATIEAKKNSVEYKQYLELKKKFEKT